VTFSKRLKEERKRLKMTQPVFAELCGVTKKSQVAYEGEALPPFAGYLERASALGVDINYVVSGQRGPTPLAAEEQILLELYRGASPALRKAALAALASGQTGAVVNHGVNNGIMAQHVSVQKGR